MAKQIKIDREFRFIRFVNRHILPRGWNISRWHNPNNKKPFELAGVYVSFGWGMVTQVPAFYKDGEFYSANTGKREHKAFMDGMNTVLFIIQQHLAK